MSTVPQGLDPTVQTREIVFDADVSLVTPFLKLATVSRGGEGSMARSWPNEGMRPKPANHGLGGEGQSAVE